MGYDMTQVVPMSAEEQAEKDRLQEEFNAAVKARSEARARGIEHTGPTPVAVLTTDAETTDPYQKAVEDTMDAMYDADKSYFRLNIWGMGYCRRAMYEIGMVYDGEEPEWPDYNEPKRDDFDSEEAWLLAVEEYDTARDKELEPLHKWHPTVAGLPVEGIPLFKFGSNDGWWVTKEECQQAVDIWEKWQAADTDPSDETKEVLGYGWWSKWIEYLKRGAQTDGFRVY